MAQARLGRTRARFSISGGSGRRPAWLRDGPYSINQKVGFFHHRSGTGTKPLDALVPSLAHLHANRLGLDRATERTVLGLLDRTLRSLAAHPVTVR